MIGGEVVAAAAALVVTGTVLAAFGAASRQRRRQASTPDIEAKVRLIVFRAIDQGDLSPAEIQALTPLERRTLESQARVLVTNLRGADRESLGRVLDRLGAVDAARAQTRSRRAADRSKAGEFLGESGSPVALRDLLELLQDPDPKVRWAAARGLGRLGHPSAVSPLLASLEGLRSVPVDVVADAVFQIRECPVPVLREGLHSASAPTRAVTVELLGRFQALAAVDDVIDLLHHDPSVEVRARAARSLGRMGSPKAVRPLLTYMDGGPVAVEAQAIWALGEIGAGEALPYLRTTLLGPSHHMSELAADALASMGQPGLSALIEISQGDGTAAAIATRALAAKKTLQHSPA